MARPVDAEVGPFGATRAGVAGLVPEARLTPGDAIIEGRYGVTENQVDRWIDELSGAVSVYLDGWERLTNTPIFDDPPVTTPTPDTFTSVDEDGTPLTVGLSVDVDGTPLTQFLVADIDGAPMSGLIDYYPGDSDGGVIWTPVVLIAGDRDRLREWARDLVHNAAGSYLEAARHPERASVNDTSYAAVLWDRYQVGLDRIGAWLKHRLSNLEPGDTEEPDADGLGSGPLFTFPEPLFGDRLRF